MNKMVGVVVFLCAFIWIAGEASVITFDDMVDSGTKSFSDFDPTYIMDQGYSLVAGKSFNASVWDANAYGGSIDYNGTDFMNISTGTRLTITKDDGGLFSLSSIVVGKYYAEITTFNFVGYVDGSQVAATSYNAPAASGWPDAQWQELSSGFSDFSEIDELVITASTPAFYENITLEAVPEPATAGLLGLSCATLYLLRRFTRYTTT